MPQVSKVRVIKVAKHSIAIPSAGLRVWLDFAGTTTDVASSEGEDDG